MTRKFRNNLIVLAGLPVILLVSACATVSRPSDFYTLSPVSAAGGVQEPPAATCRDVVIGIGPVTWPSYLDRPQIVTRLSPNRIGFDEFHRWAGPLEEDFQRVLAENLSKELQTDYVIKYPGKLLYKPRYRVQMQIDQFDGQPGDSVTLKAAWSVVDEKSGAVAALHESVLREPMAGKDYEALVVAASAAVAELSRQVAAELSSRCARSQEK